MQRTPPLPAFCERPDQVFRRAAAVMSGFALLLWIFLVGELCDWGRFTAWWSAAPGFDLESTSTSVRSVDPRLSELRGGDRVVEINGSPVESASDWTRALRHSRPGEVWTVRFLRDQAAHELKIRLGQDGWRYINAAAGIMAIPLLFLFWIAAAPSIANLDRFMLAGFLINSALSVFLCHFPLFGIAMPGLLVDLPGAASIATMFKLTAPGFAIYFLWRWPAPMRHASRAAALLLACAAIFIGLIQSGIIQNAQPAGDAMLLTVGLGWIFRPLVSAVRQSGTATSGRADTNTPTSRHWA